jgi:hypothetical protein
MAALQSAKVLLDQDLLNLEHAIMSTHGFLYSGAKLKGKPKAVSIFSPADLTDLKPLSGLGIGPSGATATQSEIFANRQD